MIVLDSTSTSAEITSASSITWSHTTGTLINGALFVMTMCRNSLNTVDDPVTGVTYNSVAMTLVRRDTSANRFISTEIWRLLNPSSGANNIVVTFTSSAGSARAAAVSLSGVDQTNPTDGSNGVGVTTQNPPYTTTITPVANKDWLLNSFYTSSNLALSVSKGESPILNTAVSAGLNDDIVAAAYRPTVNQNLVTTGWTNFSSNEEFCITTCLVKSNTQGGGIRTTPGMRPRPFAPGVAR